jgi:hypothetical protein
LLTLLVNLVLCTIRVKKINCEIKKFYKFKCIIRFFFYMTWFIHKVIRNCFETLHFFVMYTIILFYSFIIWYNILIFFIIFCRYYIWNLVSELGLTLINYSLKITSFISVMGIMDFVLEGKKQNCYINYFWNRYLYVSI